VVLEKKATVAGEGRRAANCACLRSVEAGRPRASNINGVVLAIVGAGRSLTALGSLWLWVECTQMRVVQVTQ
jgi:hypothetical protein